MKFSILRFIYGFILFNFLSCSGSTLGNTGKKAKKGTKNTRGKKQYEATKELNPANTLPASLEDASSPQEEPSVLSQEEDHPQPRELVAKTDTTEEWKEEEIETELIRTESTESREEAREEAESVDTTGELAAATKEITDGRKELTYAIQERRTGGVETSNEKLIAIANKLITSTNKVIEEAEKLTAAQDLSEEDRLKIAQSATEIETATTIVCFEYLTMTGAPSTVTRKLSEASGLLFKAGADVRKSSKRKR